MITTPHPTVQRLRTRTNKQLPLRFAQVQRRRQHVLPGLGVRGQFEAMGLAIIIVLVSLGMFFMIFFSLQKQSDFPARYDREQTAQNFVDAFIATQVTVDGHPCGATMADLIVDVQNHRDLCGQDSQALLSEQSKYILDQLFGESIPYNFSILVQGDPDVRIEHTYQCPVTTVEHDRPGFQQIPLLPTTRTATITFTWCLQ